MIREVLEIVLPSENYDVESFSTVSAFAQRNTDVHPDLYLFDVMLPEGSGIDLCKELQNNSQNKNVPIILMSAHAEPDHFINTCQPDDFISKPFDIDNLMMKVHEILNKT